MFGRDKHSGAPLGMKAGARCAGLQSRPGRGRDCIG
ncbi:hypothetical protein ACLK2H_06035 [Escherichia coli]